MVSRAVLGAVLLGFFSRLIVRFRRVCCSNGAGRCASQQKRLISCDVDRTDMAFVDMSPCDRKTFLKHEKDIVYAYLFHSRTEYSQAMCGASAFHAFVVASFGLDCSEVLPCVCVCVNACSSEAEAMQRW